MFPQISTPTPYNETLFSQETPVMRADREMRFELQEATSSSLQVLIFHRKMVELTAKEFEQIRELLMNLVSKTSKTPGKVGPLVGPDGPTVISKSKFPKN